MRGSNNLTLCTFFNSCYRIYRYHTSCVFGWNYFVYEHQILPVTNLTKQLTKDSVFCLGHGWVLWWGVEALTTEVKCARCFKCCHCG